MRPWHRGLMFAAAIVGIGVGACKADASVEQRCLDQAAKARQVDEARCDCAVSAGDFEDRATCLEFLGDDTDVDAACACAAHDDYPELTESLDCVAPHADEFTACMLAADCDDGEEDACLGEFLGAILACPQPTQDVTNEVSAMCAVDDA